MYRIIDPGVTTSFQQFIIFTFCLFSADTKHERDYNITSVNEALVYSF